MQISRESPRLTAHRLRGGENALRRALAPSAETALSETHKIPRRFPSGSPLLCYRRLPVPNACAADRRVDEVAPFLDPLPRTRAAPLELLRRENSARRAPAAISVSEPHGNQSTQHRGASKQRGTLAPTTGRLASVGSFPSSGRSRTPLGTSRVSCQVLRHRIKGAGSSAAFHTVAQGSQGARQMAANGELAQVDAEINALLKKRAAILEAGVRDYYMNSF